MKIISKLLSRNRPLAGRNHRIRGLSTAELVGIIVIVGILGALGGTYISGLVGAANTNAIAQNANSLNTVAASAVAAGATVGAGKQIDTTSVTTAINSLNAGVTLNGVTYQMSPPISAAAILTLAGSTPSYTMTATAGPPATVVFAAGAGGTVP
jgi:type II secretory pathway pseudopilin PulG